MMRMRIIALFCIAIGISAKDLRLTNNERSTDGEFPYQVSLQVNGQHLCGGALISRKHVLTAAHCVQDFVTRRIPKSSLKISVGSTTVAGGTKMDVDRISRHGSYQERDVHADIAVIRLKSPITESDSVKPIDLPKPDDVLMENTELIVSGFGTHVLNGPVSPVMKKMKMRAISRQKCQQNWPALSLSAGLMCAVNAPGLGVCQGDSGGPLTIDKKVVVGVVSAVSPNGCGSGVADLFTKVSSYMDFIQSELALSCANCGTKSA